jgi:uncharacterized YigZ family protein
LIPEESNRIFLRYQQRKSAIERDYYLTISARVDTEIKVKGSRFICIAAPAGGKEQAENFIEEIRKKHHNATHNSFAYRINDSLFRYSDDGEPAGTAGQPILSMIDKYNLQQIVVVVTRYFGGTKLGTGGLIRAYGEAAEQALRQAEILKKNNYQSLVLKYPFDLISKVQHVVQKYGGRISENANLAGMISSVEVFPSRREAFLAELNDATAGKAKIVKI